MFLALGGVTPWGERGGSALFRQPPPCHPRESGDLCFVVLEQGNGGSRFRGNDSVGGVVLEWVRRFGGRRPLQAQFLHVIDRAFGEGLPVAGVVVFGDDVVG